MRPRLAALPLLLPAAPAAGGAAADPVVYTGSNDVDFGYPDGGLRPAVGVQNYQVLRASRVDPASSDGFGWTYHHSPMMQYWRGAMYVLCNSCPVNEDADQGHVLLMVSADLGVTWSSPVVLFPTMAVVVNGTQQNTINNQRIGWWTGPSGRLYAMTAYYPSSWGWAGEDTKREWYGYAIREVHENRTFGEVHFIADNPDLYPRDSLPFPYYDNAADPVFLADCAALRADKLVTLSWWEAVRPENFAYPQSLVDFVKARHGDRTFAKAAAFYHRDDAAVVALWKLSWCAVSRDEGASWTQPVQLHTMGSGFDKVWGQRTDDGRFGISWTPHQSAALRGAGTAPKGESPRYPLIVSAGSDGVTYDVDMLNVNPEVTRRYFGKNKNYGPSNYQRGLLEGNTDDVPGQDMWIAYSMSKEDIWVSRIPLPITGFVSTHVNDTFEDMTPGGMVTNWNIYSPKFAPVRVAAAGAGGGQHLQLRDADPYDFAKAERTFPRSERVVAGFRVRAAQTDARLDVDVWSRSRGAYRPVRMWFDYSGQFVVESGCVNGKGYMTYQPDVWYSVEVEIDTQAQSFNVSINGQAVADKAAFCTTEKSSGREERGAGVESVERLVFRSGVWRGVDIAGKDPSNDRPLAKAAVWDVDDVSTRSM